MPVRIKRSKHPAVFIRNIVKLHLRMPDFDSIASRIFVFFNKNRFLLIDSNSENALSDLKHPADDPIDREIWTKFLFIEIEKRLPLLLAPETDLPRLERLGIPIQLFRLKIFELLCLGIESRFCPLKKILDKSKRALAVFRHPPLKNEIGKILFSEQLRLLIPQSENFFNQTRIVPFTSRPDRSAPFPHLPPQLVVFEIRHKRLERRHVKREPPFRILLGSISFLERTQPGRLFCVFRKPRQIGLIFDNQLPFICRIENIFRKFLRQLRQLALDFFESSLLLFRQISSILTKILQSLFEKTSPRSRKLRRLRRLLKLFQNLPKLFIQRNLREKLRNFRKHPVIRLAKRLRIIHQGQMRDFSPRIRKLLRRILERQKRVFKIQIFQIEFRQRFDFFLRPLQTGLDIGNNRFRLQFRPSNVKIVFKKWMIHKTALKKLKSPSFNSRISKAKTLSAVPGSKFRFPVPAAGSPLQTIRAPTDRHESKQPDGDSQPAQTPRSPNAPHDRSAQTFPHPPESVSHNRT